MARLSYYENVLRVYLTEHHPHLADDLFFIRTEADNAADRYEAFVHNGIPTMEARLMAYREMIENLSVITDPD